MIDDIARYFEVCGYAPEDLISIGTRAGADGPIFFTTVKVADAPRQIEARQRVNCWISACTITEPVPTPENKHPRGGIEDVVKVPALWADLDLGKLPDYKTMRAVIAEVSGLIGAEPVAIVASGHGLQPRWAFDAPLELHTPARMAPVIERFGRLVQLVAGRHGGKVDSVYDLARVLRAPGTTNLKPDLEPVPTQLKLMDGAPLSFEHLIEVLTEYVPDAPEVVEVPKAENVELARGDAYVASVLGYIREELQGIKTWKLGETDDRGRGWEKIQADAAFRLAELAKAEWNSLTEQQAKLIFADNAPLDENWTIRDVAKKWNSQWPRAEAAQPPAVVEDPLMPGYQGGDASSHSDAAVWAEPASGGGNVVVQSPPRGPDVPGAAASDGSAPMGWRKYAQTDKGMAERVIALHADSLRWSPSLKVWLRYIGGAWQESDTGGERLIIESIPRIRQLEAPLYSDTDVVVGRKVYNDRADFLKWLAEQDSAAKVVAIGKMIRFMETLNAMVTDFDRQPMLLNARNGVIDLATGGLLEHASSRMLRRQIAVDFDPEATCPRWEEFLNRVQPSADMRDYLQRIIGYTITGRTTEQVVFFHVGPPAAGKGVFLDVISDLMGEFSRVIPSNTLLNKKVEQHPTDIMGMEGRRFLQLDETPEGARLDEALLKRLSGETTISARGMGKDFVDFKIVGKVHVVTNHDPHISDDPAVHRRLHYVPWTVQIPAEERIQGLAELIVAEELPGVLAWAVRGTQRWKTDRLARPVEAEIARSTYLASEDEFGQFMEEELVVGADSFTPFNDLYRRYRQWCDSLNIKAMGSKSFSKKLIDRNVLPKRTNHARGFIVALQQRAWMPPDPLS